MKKYAYKPNSCDLCGKTVLAHEQEILALVGNNHFIHEALYICPVCKNTATSALARAASKLSETSCMSINAVGAEDPRAVMTRKLTPILKNNSTVPQPPHVGPILNRLYARLRDLQILNVDFNPQFPTSEGAFINRELDSVLKLTLLKQIMRSPEYRGRKQCDVAVVSAYFSVPSMSYEPVRGDAVAISLQLAYLINGWGEGVVDVAMKLQAKGLSPFKAVEQCVNILAMLDFSLVEAEAYAESYTAVRKTLKL